MVTTFVRGHEIYLKNGKWFYRDNNKPYIYERPCKKCGCYPTKEGYDPCLGKIEGVKNACCGHRREEDRYIQR